jgi:signal transduction histidine kinase
LDDMGLLSALVWYIQRYTEQTNIKVNLQHKGLEKRLPAEVETTIYRVIQEGLTNVARHSGAPEVTVRVLSDGSLTVLIEDEGKGFDVDEALSRHTSLGISGMRERVELLGGEMTVESTPGKGSTLLIEVPLEKLVLFQGRRKTKSV